MIRLYLDWNVLARLKAGRFPELMELLAANKHRFLVFFSTAHIGDLYKSYHPETGITDDLQTDLTFIHTITDGHCFLPNSSGDVFPDQRNPAELFENRIFSEEITHDLLNQFKAGSFQDPLLQSAFAIFSQIPGHVFTEQEDIGRLEFLLPGIKSNNSIQGMFSSMTTLFQELYASEKYKDLRTMFQQGMGINRDKMYDHPSPLKQLDQYISSAPVEASTFDEFQQKLLDATKRTPKSWFDNISEKYITIDMAGYKEDKIKVTDKKKDTFKNTIEDSFHTAFASQCLFLPC